MRRVGIIGAGISGLSLAYFLKQKKFDVHLFESSNRAGGSVRTSLHDSFLTEHGPNSLLLTSAVIQDLIDGIGLQNECIKAKKTAAFRYIVKDGKLVELPTSIAAFLKTPLFSFAAKIRLLKEPFIKAGEKENESLADFVQRRLGQEFLDYAINPFVAGVFAGDPKQLGVKHAFRKLYDLEQKYGSLIKGQFKGAKERKKSGEVAKNTAPMISFKQGLGSLISALERYLEPNLHKNHLLESIFKVNDGWSLTFKNKADSFDVDFLVSTIPSHRIHELPFTHLVNDLRATFKEVYYPPVSVVHTAYKKQDIKHILNGFGYLTPEKENRLVLGSLFSSSIFDGRADENHVLLTSFIGGARQPEVAFREDNELLDLVYKDHQDLIGATNRPVFSEIIRFKNAIPQYTTQYDEIKNAISKMESSNPGLFFSGNWIKGISMSDSITKAAELANQLSEQ